MDIISKSMILSQEYNFPEMLDQIPGKFRIIKIASAYVDPESLRNIFNYFIRRFSGTGAVFSVYMDRSANCALNGQRGHRRFKYLSTNIKNYINSNTPFKNTDDSGIFLVNIHKLFHSKAIFIETTLQERWLIIGSINMTQPGISDSGNEELFCIKKLYNDEYNNISAYFDFLAENSNEIHDDKTIIPSKLRDLFISGRLYNDIGKNKSLFNFHLELPEEVLTSRAQINEYIDQNVTNFLNILRVCSINLEGNINESWKSYCLYTDYGYWSPNEYIKYVDDILDYKKHKANDELKHKLMYIGSPEFKNKIEGIFDNISTNIKFLGYEWEVDGAKWEKWYSRLKNRLFIGTDNEININEKILPVILSGVTKADVPELWYNKDIYNDFEESFIDSLEIEYMKKKSRNFIYKTLKDAEVRDLEELKKAVKDNKVDFLKFIEE